MLVKELQALGLDMKVLDSDKNEIELRDMDDDEDGVKNIDALAKFKQQEDEKRALEEQKTQEAEETKAE